LLAYLENLVKGMLNCCFWP